MGRGVDLRLDCRHRESGHPRMCSALRAGEPMEGLAKAYGRCECDWAQGPGRVCRGHGAPRRSRPFPAAVVVDQLGGMIPNLRDKSDGGVLLSMHG